MARHAKRDGKDEGLPQSVEWYTPRWLTDEIRAFFGGDYYDPCPATYGNSPLTDGLSVAWPSPTFCNPPYGRVIGQWLHHAMQQDAEIILLLPGRIDTRWFRSIAHAKFCFLAGRVRFDSPSGVKDGAKYPSVLAYLGTRPDAFARHFAKLGLIFEQRKADAA